MSPVRLGRPSRRIPTMVSLALVVIGLYTYFSIPTLAQIAADRWQEPLQPALALVPFEAHIMSKCPDAKDCLKYMVLPAMQRVHDKVNFTLSFIGTYVETNPPPGQPT